MERAKLISKLQAMADNKLILMKKNHRNDFLDSFLYLLHHVHLTDENKEELHHCFVLDHLGNKFILDHVEGKDGITYHAVIGMEKKQDIFWSEEEAKADGQKIPCANRQL